MLFCAIVGNKGNTFSINIEESELVADLKKIVEENKYSFPAMNPRRLTLYMAKKEDGSWLKHEEPNRDEYLKKDLKMVAALSLKQYFVEGENRNEIQRPTFGEIHMPVVLPKIRSAEIVHGTILHKKRKITDVKKEIRAALLFAACRGKDNWTEVLRKLNGQIECHRTLFIHNDSSIPIVLLNETFARFERNCKTIPYEKEDCDFVVKFCNAMSSAYQRESCLANVARDMLSDYRLPTCAALLSIEISNSGTDGSHVYGNTWLLNLQVKLQKSDGGGDSTMQSIAYYIKHLSDNIKTASCLAFYWMSVAHSWASLVS
jgi:Crinkler effector protein N-terminal domain